jgi:hypothetical protein
MIYLVVTQSMGRFTAMLSAANLVPSLLKKKRTKELAKSAEEAVAPFH